MRCSVRPAVKPVLAVALLICIAAAPGCTSSLKSSPETSSASYFLNPDRVWAAIIETLIDLDYKVAESNRTDGKIRTEPRSHDDGPRVVLSIDQVMHTQDQVNVYIEPSAGDAGVAVDPSVLKAASDRFKASLDSKLKG
jgi:hypothetical protein